MSDIHPILVSSASETLLMGLNSAMSSSPTQCAQFDAIALNLDIHFLPLALTLEHTEIH